MIDRHHQASCSHVVVALALIFALLAILGGFTSCSQAAKTSEVASAPPQSSSADAGSETDRALVADTDEDSSPDSFEETEDGEDAGEAFSMSDSSGAVESGGGGSDVPYSYATFPTCYELTGSSLDTPYYSINLPENFGIATFSVTEGFAIYGKSPGMRDLRYGYLVTVHALGDSFHVGCFLGRGISYR